MNSPDIAVQHIAEDLDRTRHPSNACFYSSPGHIRAAAHLYGMETAPVEKARVLELGCGSGGNLLPFVLAYPDAQAVGVDLSLAQVQQGQRMVQDLGVENLELHAVSLDNFEIAPGEFDYIIVHGAFSSASPELRKAVLRICRESLSPQGIAYTRYNTYPGWKLGDIVRDAMLLHSHSAVDQEEKLTGAKAMLMLLSDGQAAGNILAPSLRAAAGQLRNQPDQYLIREYLENFNTPWYFLEFAEAAADAGFAYVGDAEPQAELSVTYGQNVQINHSLIALGQPKAMRQQYLDFAVGRQHRKSMLVSQERMDSILLGPDLARLADLRWAGGFRRVDPAPGAPAETAHYVNHKGDAITIDDPVAIAIVETLSHAWPASLSFQSLVLNTRDVAALSPADAQTHPKAVQRALETLFTLGALRYSLGPGPYDNAECSSLCLIPGLEYLLQPGKEAECGVMRFNLWHDGMAFTLDASETSVLPGFNGKNGFSQVAALFNTILLARAGTDGSAPSLADRDDHEAKSRHMLSRLVDLLKRQGALIGSSAAWVAYFKAALEVNWGLARSRLAYLEPLLLYNGPSRHGGLGSDKVEPSAFAAPARGQRAQPQRKGPSPEIMRRITLLREQHRYQEAESLAREQVAQFPRHVFSWHALGQVLCRVGQMEEGLDALFRAIALRPMEPVVHSDLGVVFQLQGLMKEAESSARRALILDPSHASTWNHLGVVFRSQDRVAEAEACYRRAIKLQPDNSHAYNNLGNVCADLGHMDEAMRSYRKALDIQPDYFDAYSNVLFTLTHQESTGSAELFKAHRAFGVKVERKVGGIAVPVHSNSREPERKLRLGFVSGDLWNHPVANFLEPVWRSLNKEVFEVCAYSNTAKEDEVSQRLRSYTGRWTQVSGMGDSALADTIRRDGIDVLFDLSGHTGHNRLPMFALKPAPVQLSWIGYPGTTGLNAMDYRIINKHFAPLGLLDDQFIEKLIYLPSVNAFDPMLNSPDVNVLPSLSQESFTFGSFNRLSKVSEGVFALWARVLRAVPDSRLLLGNVLGDDMSRDLKARFEKYEIEPERLIFHARVSMPAYLSLHHQVDLLLDTFPYAGGTTTKHGLWMGIPTLTWAGKTMAARAGAALMRQFELDEFVAVSQDEYVDKAVFWSGKRVELAAIRAGMRGRIETSPIGSQSYVTQSLEAALRRIWQIWCDGKAPESFEVET